MPAPAVTCTRDENETWPRDRCTATGPHDIVTRRCQLRRPLIDTTKGRYDMWLFKKYGLPSFYWHQLLRGRG